MPWTGLRRDWSAPYPKYPTNQFCLGTVEVSTMNEAQGIPNTENSSIAKEVEAKPTIKEETVSDPRHQSCIPSLQQQVPALWACGQVQANKHDVRRVPSHYTLHDPYSCEDGQVQTGHVPPLWGRYPLHERHRLQVHRGGPQEVAKGKSEIS